ncbi:biosynthetic peptidoglycan transglycosylase [Candidatus Methylacidithermus pantelleriae]|nr:biosynthetic peptidoglycan transglycosylase [Candidatus Methylacidithermus pantelleriae]
MATMVFAPMDRSEKLSKKPLTQSRQSSVNGLPYLGRPPFRKIVLQKIPVVSTRMDAGRKHPWLPYVSCLGAGFLFLVLLGLAFGIFLPLPPSLDNPLTNQRGSGSDTNARASSSLTLRVPLSLVSPWLIRATIAAEDRNFWKHHGVDFWATLRALRDALRYGKAVSGASTITQQLIKISENPPRPRTLLTKLREMILAVRLECRWTKERILEEYLNRLYYGNDQIGCAAAARFYFGKDVGRLTAAEAALLAGIPQAPARLNPYVHWERARRRQRWILGQMLAHQFLSQEQYRRALGETVQLLPHELGGSLRGSRQPLRGLGALR